MPNPSTADVRQWARSKGYDVGDRGRLSPTLVEAYLADQGAGGSAAAATATAPVPANRVSRASSQGPKVVRAKSPWNWPQLESGSRGRARR